MTRDNLKTLSLEETIVELRQAAAKADDKVATCVLFYYRLTMHI
jgi:hypothetical protein